MMRSGVISTVLAASIAGGTVLANPYVIDTEGAHASINFRVNHLGFSWLTGRFNDFTGRFHYDAADPAAAQIHVSIDTASIDSAHHERDEHLRSDDFLDVTRYPEAAFVSTAYIPQGDNGGTLEGEFTLRGITRPMEISVEKIGQGQDPWGNTRVGFSGETSFQLKDYGIDYDLGPNSETVYLTLEIEGIATDE